MSFSKRSNATARIPLSSWTAWTVRQDSQDREQVWTALDFVDDDQASQVRQGCRFISKPPQVSRRLEVKVGHVPSDPRRKLPRNSRLADLARPKESSDRLAP